MPVQSALRLPPGLPLRQQRRHDPCLAIGQLKRHAISSANPWLVQTSLRVAAHALMEKSNVAVMSTSQVGARSVRALSTVILRLKRLATTTTGRQHIANPSVLAAHALRNKSGAVLKQQPTILDGARWLHARLSVIRTQKTRVTMRTGLQ